MKNKRYLNNQSFKDSLPKSKFKVKRPQSSNINDLLGKKESG